MTAKEPIPDRLYVTMPNGEERWVRRYSRNGSYAFVFSDAKRIDHYISGRVERGKFVFNHKADETFWLAQRNATPMSKKRRSYVLRDPLSVQQRYEHSHCCHVDREGKVIPSSEACAVKLLEGLI